MNPGREAYLAFLKVKIDWQNGQTSNADYLTAFQKYVDAQAAGTSTQLDAQQQLNDTKYSLERNDLMASIEAGGNTWDDLVAYDKSKLDGLDHSSQTYLDRLNLYQASQAKALNVAAQDQHDLYDAGKITTAQLRSWYLDQAANPDLALNPDLTDQISSQVKALDLRATSEADNQMIQLYQDGKVGVDAFLTYATTAEGRYAPGSDDATKWDKIVTDAKASVAETGLTYRYGLSQSYIQLQKYISDEKAMIASAGSSSSSTSQRIVLGADGQWKTVTSTTSHPYAPTAAEQKAMAQHKIELADAERQLAEWTGKINSAGGFVTTDQMITFYSGRQADVVKGTADWYQLQTRIDGLQQQKHTETVLKSEGIRISFSSTAAASSPIKVGSGGGGSGGGGGTATTSGKATGTGLGPNVASKSGPLQVVTGYQAPAYVAGSPIGGGVQTTQARFPTNLDGSAFTKFYSGFVAAYKAGATTFTDYSSGKAVTYYLPEDLTARATMVGQLDDLRISYYATRAQVYAGTASEFEASKEYSDAIKDKADNAYTILITGQKGGAVVDLGGTAAKPQPYGGHIPATNVQQPILDPIEQGLKVKDAAKAYYAQQVKLAQQAWDRGDVTGAWSHLQLATKTAAETEAKMNTYLSAASSTMAQIYQATGQVAPDAVTKGFADLQDWQTDFAAPKKGAIDLTNEVYKWVKVGSTGQPVWNADGTLSLHDGAALFVTPDGKVNYQEVPSAGYAQPGGNGQVPDVPGYVRVTVNLGGTVPSQTVYAKWSVGTVGFTADGQPIQGKVVSGFANGQRYTLTEDPFHPGKWNLGNATYKVPTGFKATAQPGVYQFASGGKNYLLQFDPATGRYNVVTPGTAFTPEQSVPVSEADAQALLASAGFGTDLSTVDPADRWKYNLDEPYAGFTKDQYEQFTTPPPAAAAGSGGPSLDARDEAYAALRKSMPSAQTGLTKVNTVAPIPGAMTYVGKTIPGADPNLSVPSLFSGTGGPSLEDRDAAAALAQTVAAQSNAPSLASLSSLDARDELAAQNQTKPAYNGIVNTGIPTVKPTGLVYTGIPTPAPAAPPKPVINSIVNTGIPTPAPVTKAAPKTTIAPVPGISTTKLAALTKLA